MSPLPSIRDRDGGVHGVHVPVHGRSSPFLINEVTMKMCGRCGCRVGNRPYSVLYFIFTLADVQFCFRLSRTTRRTIAPKVPINPRNATYTLPINQG
jgi:hypothetical protein